MRGVETELKSAGYSDIDIEYLDTKEVGYDEAYVQLLRQDFTYKLSHKPIDVLVTTDDNALDFALRFRAELFSNAPIVFAGVNNRALIDRLDRSTVAGVVGEEAYRQTLDLMFRLHPGTKRVILLFDRTPTGNARWGQLATVLDSYPGIYFERISDDEATLEQLAGRLSRLPNDTLVLLGSFHRDATRRYISLNEGVHRITAASRRPVYGLHEQDVLHGATGGVVKSPFRQGRATGRLAVAILNGKLVRELPLLSETTGEVLFDHHQMVRFGIDRSALPPSSRVLNEPLSPWSAYRELIYLAGIVFAILVVLNVVQYFNVRYRKEIQKSLKTANRQLSYVANTDDLTKLSNRYNYEHWLAALTGDETFLIVAIDIDHFKRINEHYNSRVGDRVLCELARRLSTRFSRASRLFRTGGNEFVIVLFHDSSRVEQSVGALREIVATPFPTTDSSDIRVSVSGGYVHTDDIDHIDMLEKSLAIALDEARVSGRDRILAYTPEYARKNEQLNQASGRICDLVSQEQAFGFHAQPLIDLQHRVTVGYEVLLRLTFEDGVAIPAPVAIQACEQAGLIRALNIETFKAACRLLAMIDTERFVTINLSRAQLMVHNVAGDFLQIMADSGQGLDRVVIEITEDRYLEDAALIEVLRRFQEQSIRIALDDFGSGYSSLTSLSKLPLYMSKLDKNFLQAKGYDLSALTDLHQLCSTLGLVTLAEGIETYEDLEICAAAGICLGQGYFISPPVAFDIAAEFPHKPVLVSRTANESDSIEIQRAINT